MRTRFIARTALLALIAAELFFFLFIQTNGITVETRKIRDAALAGIFGDKVVVQLSDLHIKSCGFREKELVSDIRKIMPDIIFITGDFISSDSGMESAIRTIKSFPRSAKILAVLGNNDHSYLENTVDTNRLVKLLEGSGVTVLMNESARVTVKYPGNSGTGTAYITGIDDNFLGYDDIYGASEGVPGGLAGSAGFAGSARILLAHSPHIAEKIDASGFNLIIAGHTHGGQIVLPFAGAVYTNTSPSDRKKYVSGLYEEKPPVYVSRGIGTVLLPLRLFSRPEITVFEFVT
jgi:uncharacterized protein